MGKIFSRIKAYSKENRLFLLIMLVGTAALIIQMREVVLYADDYSLGIFSSNSFSDIIKYEINHYFTWGGGYTAFLVIILLGATPFVWKSVLILLLVAFVWLATNLICYNESKDKWNVALILWACIFGLSIWVSREVFYWLDGAMAYLFSMFQVFLLFYFAFSRIIQGKHASYDFIIIPLVAFFAGWSSAQSGFIAVLIIPALLIWQKLVRKEKASINKIYCIAAVLSIVGFLIFLLSPGNYARMDTFSEYSSLNIFGKVAYRLDDVLDLILYNYGTDFSAAPIFLYMCVGFLSIVCLKNSKTFQKQNKIISIICSVYGIITLFACLLSRIDLGYIQRVSQLIFTYPDLYSHIQNGTFSILHLVPFIAALLLILTSLINAFLLCQKNKNPLLVCLLLFAYLFQGCMVMAPYSPLRTTFYTTAFVWIAIAYLTMVAKKESIKIIPIFLIILMIQNFYFGIVMSAFYFVTSNLVFDKYLNIKNLDTVFIITSIGLIAISNYAVMVSKYHCNRIVNEENITRLMTYESKTEDGAGEVLYLVKPCDEIYGFTGLTGIDWVEKAVINYYKLPTQLDLKYEGE